MKLSTLIFGKEIYRIDIPEPTWKQTPDGDTYCSKCGESLTFVFPAHTDPKASSGFAYMYPTGVRCKCFLDEDKKLKRPPVPIILEPGKKEDNSNECPDRG